MTKYLTAACALLSLGLVLGLVINEDPTEPPTENTNQALENKLEARIAELENRLATVPTTPAKAAPVAAKKSAELRAAEARILELENLLAPDQKVGYETRRKAFAALMTDMYAAIKEIDALEGLKPKDVLQRKREMQRTYTPQFLSYLSDRPFLVRYSLQALSAPPSPARVMAINSMDFLANSLEPKDFARLRSKVLDLLEQGEGDSQSRDLMLGHFAKNRDLEARDRLEKIVPGYLKHASESTRLAAVGALRSIQSEAAYGPLADAFLDASQSPAVCEAIVQGLAYSVADAIIPDVLRMTKHPSAPLRAKLYKALFLAVKPIPGHRRVLRQRFEVEQDAKVLSRLISVLGRIGDRDAAAALEHAAEVRFQDPALEKKALAAVAKIRARQ